MILKKTDILSPDQLSELLKAQETYVVVVFDLETNGFNPSESVLSCSALKFSFTPENGRHEETDRFNRFYFSREKYNYRAVQVNGLSEKILIKKREDRDWPAFFREDGDFSKFLDDCDILVAHNIKFDLQFLWFPVNSNFYCTMLGSMAYFPKYPKLIELANYLGVSYDADNFHESLYDVIITADIFFRQINAEKQP